ncbi:hypothetical protein [Streptomyces sp. NPDC046985]|uniref:hypothetical protein n=1 Tax=Streptomyces sp. NPDC046985 TaxID=3155377 RepID=UPI0033E72D8F
MPSGSRLRPGASPRDDLVSVLEHIAASKHVGQVVRVDEAHSVRNGTIAWRALGRQQTAAGEPKAD